MSQLLNITTFNDDYWMTSDEAQVLLKVSRSSLYRWRKTRQLPYTQIGGILYFPRTYIKQLMVLKLQNGQLPEPNTNTTGLP